MAVIRNAIGYLNRDTECVKYFTIDMRIIFGQAPESLFRRAAGRRGRQLDPAPWRNRTESGGCDGQQPSTHLVPGGTRPVHRRQRVGAFDGVREGGNENALRVYR